MSVDINVEHLVAYAHTKNILESLIKHLQLIVRPLLLKTKLPFPTSGYNILHVIYDGFHLSSIIYYLKSLTYDVYILLFIDYHFDENVFLPLRRSKSISNK